MRPHCRSTCAIPACTSRTDHQPRRAGVLAAVPAVVGWRRQASLDLATAWRKHRRLAARRLGFPARHEVVEGVPPRPCARDALHRTHRGWRMALRAVTSGRRTAADARARAAAGIREIAGARSAPGRAMPFPRRTTAAPATKERRCRCWASARCSLSPDRDPLAPHAERPRTRVESALARAIAACCAICRRRCSPRPPRIAAATPAERAALGYLHGNCGHCHNDEGPLAVLGDDAGAACRAPQDRQPTPCCVPSSTCRASFAGARCAARESPPRSSRRRASSRCACVRASRPSRCRRSAPRQSTPRPWRCSRAGSKVLPNQ